MFMTNSHKPTHEGIKMDISKSMHICLKRVGMQKKELAEELGTTPQTVSIMSKSKYCSPDLLEKMCVLFDMKASEFIALGESND